MRTINPSTEEVIGEFPPDSAAEIDASLSAAASVFPRWRRLPVQGRADFLSRLAAVFRDRRGDFARLMAIEMGKPLAAGEAEIQKCAAACDYIAQHAAALLAPRELVNDGGRGFCRFDPLGVILAIMPWNFPFWQLIRFGASSLAAGNVIALKHAPNVPQCAAAIADAFIAAGFPPGVLVNLHIDENAAAQTLCAESRIAAVTLTGSDRAGAAVAASCGSHLKKTVMELGGSDPFIVLADADIARAAAAAAESRCINAGQSCIAAKRFIVQAPIYDAFVEAFRSALSRQTLGDALDPAAAMGPLARLDLLENLHSQVSRSVAAGAAVLMGGRRAPRRGYFYEPTILAGVRPGMAVFDEETFGPVAAVVRAADPAAAIQLANQTRFGLGASVWSRDLNAAAALAADIDAGNVFINSMVRSDARLPFGGTKSSGWGRELAEQGLQEFTNVKTVWIAPP